MNDTELAAIVEKAELSAERDPPGYMRHLALLAAYGYSFVFLVVFGFIALSALVLGLMIVFHVLFLVKFAILLLIPAWLVLKSLWVKFEPPTGVPLTREMAPDLFELIDKTREAARGPQIHEVLLDDNFNCGIVQHPRLGLLGFHKNFLVLGLPLLESLPEAEFTAVLAHEMGHLSKNHGKLGLLIEHVRLTWVQVYINLASEGGDSASFVQKFAEWFVPYYDAHSLALRRNHEYAADQIAASVTDAETASRALVITTIRGSHSDDQFWEDLAKQTKTQEKPPDHTYELRAQRAKEALDVETIVPVLEQSWKKHKPLDSHPSLSERVSALQPRGDWNDLQAIAQAIAACTTGCVTAAEALLGKSLAPLRNQLEAGWLERTTPIWEEQYQLFKHRSEVFNELSAKLETGDELTDEEVDSLASVVIYVKEKDEAIAYYRDLAGRYPNASSVLLPFGYMLLRDKSDEGISVLEKAIVADTSNGASACGMIAGYLEEHDRADEAKAYHLRAEEYGLELLKASRELQSIADYDKFEEHKLDPAQVAAICDLLKNNYPTVKEAFLISKIVPALVGGHQHILVVKIGGLYVSQDEMNKVVGGLAGDTAVLSGFYITTWEGLKNVARQACKKIASAKVYERDKWDAAKSLEMRAASSISKASSKYSQRLQAPDMVPSAKSPVRVSFWGRYRSQIIAVSVIAVFGAFGWYSGSQKHKHRHVNPLPHARMQGPMEPETARATHRTCEPFKARRARIGIRQNLPVRRQPWFPSSSPTTEL